ncbi:trypsin iota-like [Anticarsia gemmatalis]|uniref:trypsin iota-like n=1 Tax=Anticarsia gemmatalis TaxID=129554 RepID=UPI003F769F9E
MWSLLFVLTMMSKVNSDNMYLTKSIEMYKDLEEHTMVTDNEIFPYVVAILKMAQYISAGALIHEDMVLTAADSLFFLGEAARLIRVRLGSINCKKGGVLLPIQYFEIHPQFDDQSPVYDVALIRLSNPVRFTPYLRSIRIQKTMKEVDTTHFIVTAWPLPGQAESDESNQLKSMEMIKRRRILSVTHLHPLEPDDCAEELRGNGVNDSSSIMCLDTTEMADPCVRDVGAPVVLNDILWGIVSSWRLGNCENELAGSSFVTLVAAPNITKWINSVIRGNS